MLSAKVTNISLLGYIYRVSIFRVFLSGYHKPRPYAISPLPFSRTVAVNTLLQLK